MVMKGKEGPGGRVGRGLPAAGAGKVLRMPTQLSQLRSDTNLKKIEN